MQVKVDRNRIKNKFSAADSEIGKTRECLWEKWKEDKMQWNERWTTGEWRNEEKTICFGWKGRKWGWQFRARKRKRFQGSRTEPRKNEIANERDLGKLMRVLVIQKNLFSILQENIQFEDGWTRWLKKYSGKMRRIRNSRKKIGIPSHLRYSYPESKHNELSG